MPGQLLAAVGLAAATYAVVLAGRDGLRLPVLLALAVAAAALAAFGVVERRSADPVLPLALLRRPAFTGAALGAFAASLAVFVLLSSCRCSCSSCSRRTPCRPRCACSP
jgi:DHA2 family methylenomycin A resistance protein-like MFS transporter